MFWGPLRCEEPSDDLLFMFFTSALGCRASQKLCWGRAAQASWTLWGRATSMKAPKLVKMRDPAPHCPVTRAPCDLPTSFPRLARSFPRGAVA